MHLALEREMRRRWRMPWANALTPIINPAGTRFPERETERCCGVPFVVSPLCNRIYRWQRSDSLAPSLLHWGWRCTKWRGTTSPCWRRRSTSTTARVVSKIGRTRPALESPIKSSSMYGSSPSAQVRVCSLAVFMFPCLSSSICCLVCSRYFRFGKIRWIRLSYGDGWFEILVTLFCFFFLVIICYFKTYKSQNHRWRSCAQFLYLNQGKNTIWSASRHDRGCLWGQERCK